MTHFGFGHENFLKNHDFDNFENSKRHQRTSWLHVPLEKSTVRVRYQRSFSHYLDPAPCLPRGARRDQYGAPERAPPETDPRSASRFPPPPKLVETPQNPPLFLSEPRTEFDSGSPLSRILSRSRSYCRRNLGAFPLRVEASSPRGRCRVLRPRLRVQWPLSTGCTLIVVYPSRMASF